MSPEPNARDAAGRTLTVGLVLLTLPTALLVLGGVGTFLVAASSDADAGGFAVLFALQFLVPALVTSPFPIVGWALRARRPRGSATTVVVAGVLLLLVVLVAAIGPLVYSGGSLPVVLLTVLGLVVAGGMTWCGARSLTLLDRASR